MASSKSAMNSTTTRSASRSFSTSSTARGSDVIQHESLVARSTESSFSDPMFTSTQVVRKKRGRPKKKTQVDKESEELSQDSVNQTEVWSCKICSNEFYSSDVDKLMQCERCDGASCIKCLGITYLDHTGTTLYAASQLKSYHDDLMRNVYGNPHSQNASSQLSADTVEQVRYRILQHFNTTPDQHSVIFTSGCTGALKLLAETFDWKNQNGCTSVKENKASKNPATDCIISAFVSSHETDCINTSGSNHGTDCITDSSMSNYAPDYINTSVSNGCTNNTSASKYAPDFTNNTSVSKQSTDCTNLTSDKTASESNHAADRTNNASVSNYGNDCINASFSKHSTNCTNNTSNQATSGSSGWFSYLDDNHTSVIGIREIARDKGAHVASITKEKVESNFQNPTGRPKASPLPSQHSNCLFAYPAQSNFSGYKYSLNWCTKVKQGQLSDICCYGNWYVVLDAAAMVATSPLDLGQCTADFVTVSFYKMFGFPTGLGALIVRKGSEVVLRKRYFGGGTVQAYLGNKQFHAPKTSIVDWFEDGTTPFLDIVAVKHGLDTLERLAGSMVSIQKHTFALAKYVYDKMNACCHGNGSPIARLFCHGNFEDMEEQGPIINFNLLRPNGEYVGYAEVDSLAALHNIHLRTGCFCNTGACQSHLGLSSQQIMDNFQAGHICGDDVDIIDGQPTGSVRISFGYMSTKADADQFLQFLQDCFMKSKDVKTDPKGQDDMSLASELTNSHNDIISELDVKPTGSIKESFLKEQSVLKQKSESPNIDATAESKATQVNEREVIFKLNFGEQNSKVADSGAEIARNCGNEMVLTNIYLYPVKSCGAMEVSEWELGPRGLIYDRHWMIVNSSGVSLSQKRESNMCLIKPYIDLHAGIMRLTYPGLHAIEIPLESSHTTTEQVTVSKLCHSKICGDRVEMYDCGDTIATWLEEALGKPCRLLQQNDNFERACKFKQGLPLDQNQQMSLAQESPYLLLNRNSCIALLENMQRHLSSEKNKGHIDGHPGALVKRELPELENLLARFRGNLVIDNLKSFEEDKLKRVKIGSQVFLVGGLCSRCQMICIDQDTAERSKEPLMSLTFFRGKRVPFGVHLLRDSSSSMSVKLCVNDRVTVLETTH